MTPTAAQRGLLFLILLTATALRLWHVGFGLPSLNDPDEPLFVMTALDMLRDGSLNPGWFGHPATVLLYALALIFVAVGAVGFMLERWDTTDGFVSALYADPGIAILPMRLFILLCGVTCVYLTYRIGKRTIGTGASLVAAALLACNALHIEYSQIIRTDMLASVFMLLSTLYALRVVREGRVRDQLLAGAMAGLACATKWPGAVIVANALGAAAARRSPKLAVAALIGAAAALLLASPFLILDYLTVLRDLSGEARPIHLGATGGSSLQNLAWYLTHAIMPSFGPLGTVLVLVGPVLVLLRLRGPAAAVLPGVAAFLSVIIVQSLVWIRWIIPLLPFACLAAALVFDHASKAMPDTLRRRVMPLACVVLFAPMLLQSQTSAQVRANDTRQQATAWVLKNTPPGASVLLEHAGFDLLSRPGPVLFPLGSEGCIDVRRALSDRIRYRSAGRSRAGRAIVDLGNISANRLSTCRADFAILSHYARYTAEASHFGNELGNYRSVLVSGKVVATFDPVPDLTGGPSIQIVRLGGRRRETPFAR